ncbi:expressed unknown protein [Ectocarpus siliculosus]|uniref:Uncharacterized protein n=1 Tax=Ectocarpus siliculosus TaxID=2880 RepID=D8LAS4_ECTSI|nr:expressed unknown protein [Ectocarpus siliculosus]|eukprot:CBN76433.1 expressed unknown protein [Ectocarpus siliculosus]
MCKVQRFFTGYKDGTEDYSYQVHNSSPQEFFPCPSILPPNSRVRCAAFTPSARRSRRRPAAP